MHDAHRHLAPRFEYDQQSSASVDYYAAMNIAQILQDYGYPAVFLGTLHEGETIMLLGGLAAHPGYLSLDWVIACGFCGTLIGDQLYFFWVAARQLRELDIHAIRVALKALSLTQLLLVQLVAFAKLMPEYGSHSELSVDLMRYAPKASPGSMDLLFPNSFSTRRRKATGLSLWA